MERDFLWWKAYWWCFAGMMMFLNTIVLPLTAYGISFLGIGPMARTPTALDLLVPVLFTTTIALLWALGMVEKHCYKGILIRQGQLMVAYGNPFGAAYLIVKLCWPWALLLIGACFAFIGMSYGGWQGRLRWGK